MSKLPIKTIVEGLLKLQETGDSATILGIGPMSKNCVQATLELSKDEDFPVMFIASRNQVDSDEFGGGYVNGWDQKRFATAVEEVAKEIGYDNFYYLCRDHGGPWQRDKEMIIFLLMLQWKLERNHIWQISKLDLIYS